MARIGPLGAFLTVGGIGLLLLFLVIGPYLTVTAWNHLLPLTHLPPITFWDAVAGGWILAAIGGAFKSTQTVSNHVHTHNSRY